MSPRLAAVILAAGQGTRMKSQTPKVLHPLNGRPMLSYVLANALALGERPIVVVGVGAEAVQAALGPAADYVVQREQLGTGHAVQQAESLLRGRSEQVLVLYGDMPLLRQETLAQVVRRHRSQPGPVTITTIIREDSQGFGRVLRRPDGAVEAVVEEAQATPAQLAV